MSDDAKLTKRDFYVCPKCGGPLQPKGGTMYFRGQFFAGLLCRNCNALWDNPDDSMFDAAFHAARKP